MTDPHAEEFKPSAKDHLLSNDLYDRTKFIAQIFLPALGTFYFTLAGIWGLPSAEEIIGTIIAFDTFLGVVLHISTKSYNKSENKFDGSIDIVYLDDKKTFTLNLNAEPSEIEKADQITFKVNPPIF